MPIDRRAFLASPLVAPLAAGALIGVGSARAGQTVGQSHILNAATMGVVPNAAVDQSAALQAVIDGANGRAVFLPAGRYQVVNVALRTGTVLCGAGIATTLQGIHEQPAISAMAVENVTLADLSISAGASAPAAIMVDRVAALRLERCAISGAAHAVSLQHVSGSISGCQIFGAGQTGLFCQDAVGMEIVHNTVEDCANNGIQIWRATKGDDGTIIAHNRVRNIAAKAGGSGENGNGINIFRAGGVMVSANRIEDCAYSAVRSNAGSNCQILGNSCTRLGEVAIYAEFGFEGAVVASNIIDTAASGIAITNFNEGGRFAVCSGNLVRNLAVRDH
ncbi:MAG: TIGR03808 family TAT-translocated repetitive protein, partial [Alphaproteobacteria bacterium]